MRAAAGTQCSWHVLSWRLAAVLQCMLQLPMVQETSAQAASALQQVR